MVVLGECDDKHSKLASKSLGCFRPCGFALTEWNVYGVDQKASCGNDGNGHVRRVAIAQKVAFHGMNPNDC